MEKLTRYNQKLLAIIGTIVLVALSLTIIIALTVFIIESLSRYNRNHVENNEITVEDTDPKDSTQTILRDQQISFDTPVLIDTTKAVYLIGVSQVNLKEEEETSSKLSLYGGESAQAESDRTYNYSASGNYNNIMIYRRNENSMENIFNRKVNITSFENNKVLQKHLLFMNVITKDSNKDGRLSYEDINSLFIYDIDTKQLKEIHFDNLNLVSFRILHNSPEVTLRFSIDKNKDGRYDTYREPLILKKLNTSTMEVSDMISEKMINKMQKLVD